MRRSRHGMQPLFDLNKIDKHAEMGFLNVLTNQAGRDVLLPDIFPRKVKPSSRKRGLNLMIAAGT